MERSMQQRCRYNAELKKVEQYETMNQTYGAHWNVGADFVDTQVQPPVWKKPTHYKQLTNTRMFSDKDLPKDRSQLGLAHDPSHPCGIHTMSNVPTNTRGQFSNVHQDFWADRQGLYSNAQFNKPDAKLKNCVGTYSNLQGAWSRLGPSTYDSMHGPGPWVNEWATQSFEPATLRSLYDHRNVAPRDNWVPIDNTPQNQPYAPRPQ